MCWFCCRCRKKHQDDDFIYDVQNTKQGVVARYLVPTLRQHSRQFFQKVFVSGGSEHLTQQPDVFKSGC
ncbi:hypothetical protein D910_09403 [Dendroctonus ponderosae]